MLSNRDIKIVESVLSMTEEQRNKFMSDLSVGSIGYLENIIDQYEKTLD